MHLLTTRGSMLELLRKLKQNQIDNTCHLNAGLGSCLLIKFSPELTHVHNSNTSQVTSALLTGQKIDI